MRISFIGAGNMATAIIKSVINSGRMNASEIFVFDKFDEKVNALAQLGANKCESLSDACNFSDVILLAVKPQDYPELLENIRNCTNNLVNKTFISIAAAISCGYVCSVLGCNCPVVRVMPNTPLLIGEGATAISRNEYVSDKLYSKICTLFAASGCVCSLDEDMMNNVISVNS